MQLAIVTEGPKYSMVWFISDYTIMTWCSCPGIEVFNDPFVVGSRAVVTCSSDSGVVDRIEWVSREGEVLASGTSIQQLMYVVDPVWDNLHGSEFICNVTRNQVVFNQTLPLTLRGK